MSLDLWLEQLQSARQPAVVKKDTFSTSDLATGGDLTPAQVRQFLRLAIDRSVFVGACNNITNDSTAWEMSHIDLSQRILHVGTEGQRLSDGDREKPVTTKVEMATHLFKAEVVVTEETFEDNIEKGRLADTLMDRITARVGADVEEIVLKSDTDRTGSEDLDLKKFNGVIAQLQNGLPSAQKVDATSYTSYEDLFAAMHEALPSRYRRDPGALRLYVPTVVGDRFLKEIGARGTQLGDRTLVDGLNGLKFRGTPIVEIPLLTGASTINSAAIDYSKFCFLVDPKNLYIGWHRRIRMRRWEEVREGTFSFLVSLRFDAVFADPKYGVLASNVSIAA